MIVRTPSQTIGPFFHVGLKWENGNQVELGSPGEQIVLTGHIYDGAGAIVTDALIETWQADSTGKIPGAGSAGKAQGYSRAATDEAGMFTIETLMPGACRGPAGEAYAPQLHVTLFARGLLKAVRTRVFMASREAIKDDPLAHAAGPRAATLIAAKDARDPKIWRWDVRLQGKDETVFIET
jgi:protocatechuate 3,4-dioxygenase alpha subunit